MRKLSLLSFLLTLSLTAAESQVVGWVDQLSCTVVFGWAADKSTPTQPVTVQVWDGQVLLGSMVANAARPDTASAVGGGSSGNHGFGFSLPASVRDGRAHDIRVKFSNGVEVPGNKPALTCPAGGLADYTGWVDKADCTVLFGWAANRAAPLTPATVTIFDRGVQIGTAVANLSRPDTAGVVGGGSTGQHGFVFPIPPSIRDGQAHSISVRFADGKDVAHAGSGPLALSCSTQSNFTGFVDRIDCNNIFGWAADRANPGTPVRLAIYNGATKVFSTTTNSARPDVAALGLGASQGFSMTTAQLGLSGNLNLSLKFEDTGAAIPPSSAAANGTLTCGVSGPVNTGWVDRANCNVVSGWAADKNSTAPISLDLYNFETKLGTVQANLPRADVAAIYPGNHGFGYALPPGLPPIQHLRVYYAGTKTLLGGEASKDLNCGGGNAYLGVLESATCTQVTGWAKDPFSSFSSVTLWVDDQAYASASTQIDRPDLDGLLGVNNRAGFQIFLPAGMQFRAGQKLTVRKQTYPEPDLSGPALANTIVSSCTAPPPTLSCNQTVGVAPIVRAEGLTELLADVNLFCRGGTPTASGADVPRYDVQVKLNTGITSRLLEGTWTEALLFVDEPHSVTSPSVPLLPCGASSTLESAPGSGSCVVKGTGDGVGVYNGAPFRPNVFQGKLVAPDTIVFPSVPIDSSGAPGSGPGTTARRLRIKNIRGNMRPLGVSETLVPTQAQAVVTIGGGAVPVLDYDLQPRAVTMGFIRPGIDVAWIVPAGGRALTQCQAENPSLFGKEQGYAPSTSLTGVTLQVGEGFSAAFRKRNIGTTTPDRAGELPLNQNVPDAVYGTESGFSNYDPSRDPVPNPPPYLVTSNNLTVGATAAFPSIRGLSQAGHVETGTRIRLHFSNIPAGAEVWLGPAKLFNALSLSGFILGSPAITIADANGGGSFVLGAPLNGLYKLPVSVGAREVDYEVFGTDQFAIERLEIPLYLAYPANGVATGTLSVAASLSPYSSATSASASATIPRFNPWALGGTAFTVRACGN